MLYTMYTMYILSSMGIANTIYNIHMNWNNIYMSILDLLEHDFGERIMTHVITQNLPFVSVPRYRSSI